MPKRTSKQTNNRTPPPRATRGGLTTAELNYIREQIGNGISPAVVAKALNRKVVIINNAISRMEQKAQVEAGIVPAHFPHLAHAKAILFPDELRHYESQYKSLLAQMDDEVVATELFQIHKAVVYEILITRNLNEQKGLQSSLAALRQVRDQILGKYPDPKKRPAEAKADLMMADQEARQVTDSITAKSKEFGDLDSKQQKLLEDLKATRNQRLEKIESRKRSYLEFIRQMTSEEKRDAEGRRAELLRRATARKAAELGRPVKFADDSYDSPLTNCDTVLAQQAGDGPAEDDPCPN